QRIRSRDREARVSGAANPRDDRAVVEADDELRPHPDATAHSLDDPHDVGSLAARRHEVEHARDALFRLPRGLEDEGVVQIAARRRTAGFGSDEPAAVLLRAEERCEARTGVEPRKAEPVDGPAAFDERRGLQVADQGVVLDASGHRFSISSPKGGHRFFTARLNACSYSSATLSSSVRAKRSRMS